MSECTCKTCTERHNKEYEIAKQKWDNGERNLGFKRWEYTCGDG